MRHAHPYVFKQKDEAILGATEFDRVSVVSYRPSIREGSL